ncbi:hypothetical protein JDV02_008789 [Purpureocillium takamizusanense]|uniref:Protein kinase domain-containing protein n=1 Tax=Purpureocillium takamizusanense TaxID=2060973 RepID=A0A9Q8QPK7_9HYPO|nr:uncharacterized protein JDV02_008789 [Purpureocillium takamizusanense]UNI22946.1 hypothetical protein JDV02_008789 [Purpureocillium takamizusanense]
MSSCSDSEGDYDLRFLLPQDVGDTEDAEGYRLGGFHPVHLNDRYDDGRYRIVHKLGADVTVGNLVLTLSDIDCYGEDDIYRLFGRPVTGVLETQSGVKPGPEAPRYIVGNIDFLSSPETIIKPDLKLVDFDQCFPVSSPPQKMMGTPIEFLAPEVAVGQAASPASDVWALGCCRLRLRSGRGPFSSPFDVVTPCDLMRYVIHTLGEAMPPQWQQTVLWDRRGQPTRDASKGTPHDQWWAGEARSLRSIVYNIWDEPKDRVVQTGISRPERTWWEHEHQPFPPHLSDMVWNPKAVKIDNIYVYSYSGDWDELLEALPKISEQEAILLNDLLAKIFVYDPADRLTAEQMLDHPWFQFVGQDQAT